MLFLSFLASLSLLASSRPIYLFVGPVIYYSCRLGLMGFLLFILSILYDPHYWAFLSAWASTNGPQQVIKHINYLIGRFRNKLYCQCSIWLIISINCPNNLVYKIITLLEKLNNITYFGGNAIAKAIPNKIIAFC